MSVPVYVDAYSGYKADDLPRQFTLDEEIYEIAAVLDHWYEPSTTYFKVQSTEGKTYLLRYDAETDEWTLQSGFDGDELLARPSITLITVDADAILRAEKLGQASSMKRRRYFPGGVDVSCGSILCFAVVLLVRITMSYRCSSPSTMPASNWRSGRGRQA
jgi:hypothetical protein